jgi:hypothetical protein
MSTEPVVCVVSFLIYFFVPLFPSLDYSSVPIFYLFIISFSCFPIFLTCSLIYSFFVCLSYPYRSSAKLPTDIRQQRASSISNDHLPVL